jgi:hypothetical protein
MSSPSRRPRISGDPVFQRLEFGAPALPLTRYGQAAPIRPDPGHWGYWMPAGAGMTAARLACPTPMHEVID